MAGVNGLVSGIDTGAIVSGIMAAARQPLVKLQQQFDQLSAQRTAMQEFNGLLGDLQAAVEAMDTSSEMGSLTLTSSQPANLGVTATGSPVPGTYDVQVQALADNTIRRSDGYSSPTQTLRAGDVTFTINGTVTNVPLDSALGTRTIQGLADYINQNVSGATAYIEDAGSGSRPYRLIVEGADGAANAVQTQITQSGSGERLKLNQTQAASDAQLTVDGTTFFSPSNDVTNAIPGLTLALQNPTVGTAQITVGIDVDAAAENVSGVVEAYNEVMDFIAKQSGSSNSEGGPLAGDSTMRTIQRRIQGVLNTTRGTGAVSGLYSMGLGSTQSGHLEFDAAKFKSTFAANPADAMATITGPTGLFGKLASRLDIIGDPVTGFIQPRIEGFDTRMGELTDRVERQEERLVQVETSIREQFVAMELVLARYQSTGNFLEQQIAQWNKS